MKPTALLLALVPLLPLVSACIPNGDCTRGANGWVGYDCANEGDRESFIVKKKHAGVNCWKGPALGVGCQNKCNDCPC